MKTLIRRASADDFPTLLEIDTACFPEGIAYDAVELAHLMSHSGAETLILEEDGEIAAFLLFHMNRRRRSATLITLDVRAGKRRHGYATQLVEKSESLLRDYGTRTYDLQVDVENAAAIAFYRKHGFETSRRLPGYYATGRDAWQMVKKLPPGGAASPGDPRE